MKLESPETKMGNILGARLCKVKEINQEVLSRARTYQTLIAKSTSSMDRSPLKAKKVLVEDQR